MAVCGFCSELVAELAAVERATRVLNSKNGFILANTLSSEGIRKRKRDFGGRGLMGHDDKGG
jgi:hypothetical protein